MSMDRSHAQCVAKELCTNMVKQGCWKRLKHAERFLTGVNTEAREMQAWDQDDKLKLEFTSTRIVRKDFS